jgi:serpin B
MHNQPLSRRRFLSLAGGLAAGGLLSQFASARGAGAGRVPVTALGKLVAGNSAFAIDLYRKLAAEKGNAFFSPFSISAALSMTSAGAKGKTLEEMQTVLHLPDDPHTTFGNLLGFVNGTGAAKRKHELTTANAIWGMKGSPWRKEFINLLSAAYKAGVSEVDFKDPEPARKQINDWVEKETKEKIKDLIPDGALTPLTRMVLANAVYFKGEWADKFDKSRTQEAPFTLADGSKAKVPLMMQAGNYDYGEYSLTADGPKDDVQVVQLPYHGNKASMLVFLPKEPAGVNKLAAWLKTKHFESGELRPRRVDLSLPRFKAESSFSLKDVLVDMGMKLAFDDGAADFSGMHSGEETLFIAAVRHKAYVDVNEEGTEAAAATDVDVATKGGPPEITIFRADRPFIFAIRDETTDSILFLGRYSGPAK